MWTSGLLTDRGRYAALASKELEALNDLAVGIEAARVEIGRMRENARRTRIFAAFSTAGFFDAPPERKRAVAIAMDVAYRFHGREKRIARRRLFLEHLVIAR